MSRVTAARLTPAIALILTTTYTYVRAQDHGPAPLNTTQSISAGADDDIANRHDESSGVHGSEHAAGTYTGVAPGSATPPPAAAPVGKGPTTITWPGFQMRPDGTSRVFIQSNAPVTPQPTAAPGKYLLHLPGARVSAGTNRLPLDTRYFNTPVSRVSLSADHNGATVLLELRADVEPQLSSEVGSTGYYFTFIDLPKGQFIASAPHAKAPEANVSTAQAKPTKRASTPDDLTARGGSAPPKPSPTKAPLDDETPPGIKLRR
jgi:hypothetical protein